MCAGGNVWANCVAQPSSAHQKQENGQAFPAAHIFQMQLPSSTHLFGKFQLWIFGLREWTITKLSRPFFSIEQSR